MTKSAFYDILLCSLKMFYFPRKETAMKLEVVVGMLIIALLMFWSSYRRGDLTARQAKKNDISGYSALSHGGLWGALLVIPFVCGLIWKYEDQWGQPHILRALVIGGVLNHLMHTIWLYTSPPDHNITDKARLTQAGKLHYLFMFFALASITLFFFYTQDTDPRDLGAVSFLLGTYVTMNTVVLNLIRQKKLDIVALLTTAAVWAFILYRI